MSTVLVIIALTSLALFSLWKWNTRPRFAGVSPTDAGALPSDGFSHQLLESLLGRFVKLDGAVDYQSWHDDERACAQLDQYLGSVAVCSPDNMPERFPTNQHELAYWLNVYNACVIKGILDRWPLGSVREVKTPIEVLRGLGFFHTLEFMAGGQRYNLYDMEHRKVLDPSQDPRVHFFLNCGSKGCPVMRPTLPTGQNLDEYLDQAAREFIDDKANVAVDHDAQEIRLNRIFKWYSKDFERHLERVGAARARGVVDYIAKVGSEALRSELAKAAGYRVRFVDYDWSVNAGDE